MKKTLLYSLAVLASVTLASCNGDYDDWANPQANEQEASAAKYGITFAAGTEAESSLPDDDGIINLVTVNSSDADVTGFTLKDLKVNGEAIKGEINGNSIQVDATELEKILCSQNKSRASVARDINVESKVSVNLASGDAVAINTVGTTTAKLKPSPTPAIDEKGYYMLGEVNGNGWKPTKPVWMNKVSDGVYQLKVTTEILSSTKVASGMKPATGMLSTQVSWVARKTVAKMLLVQSIILATAGVLHSQWLS